MSIVYIGIGSNIGDRIGNCLKAIDILKEKGLKIISQSSIYEMEPWGVEEQPRFINMALKAMTSLDPFELLRTLKDIENVMGRKPSQKWGPRLIDLDILLYDDIIINTDDLVIPHPFMHERRFVLEPLAEIAPDVMHPVLSENIKDLLEKIR